MYERDFVEHTGFDLVNLKQNNAVFQYPKTMTVLELLTSIAASAGVEVASVRIWAFESRQNRTTRPESCLDVADGEKTIFQAAQDASTESKVGSPSPRLFLWLLHWRIPPQDEQVVEIGFADTLFRTELGFDPEPTLSGVCRDSSCGRSRVSLTTRPRRYLYLVLLFHTLASYSLLLCRHM